MKKSFASIFLFFILGGVVIVSDGFISEYEAADIIVVPGNTVHADGSLSARLQSRVDKAVEIYNAGYSKKILVSGAVGKEGVDEAKAMAKYIISAGVPESDVVIDSAGFTTQDTARNTAVYIKSNKLNSVIVATQYFHVSRSKLALRQQGVEKVYGASASYVELRDLYSIPREVVAYLKYLI